MVVALPLRSGVPVCVSHSLCASLCLCGPLPPSSSQPPLTFLHFPLLFLNLLLSSLCAGFPSLVLTNQNYKSHQSLARAPISTAATRKSDSLLPRGDLLRGAGGMGRVGVRLQLKDAQTAVFLFFFPFPNFFGVTRNCSD